METTITLIAYAALVLAIGALAVATITLVSILKPGSGRHVSHTADAAAEDALPQFDGLGDPGPEPSPRW